MTEYLGLRTVLARGLDAYADTHTLDAHQWQVCRHVLACRTEAMGGVVMGCARCGYESPWYYACRDRHCPRCGRRASEAWCEKQQRSALPVTYFHLVFTLPHVLNGWVHLHPDVIYALLFEAVAHTLKAFGADPKRLSGQIGATLVLHTWGQTLGRHVHLHCLVPGGALQRDGTWKSACKAYLFPVRALSRHVRGYLVGRLRQAWKDGRLPRIADAGQVDAVLDRLMACDWVVYCRHSIEHTDTLVGYLARYSHRVALSDSRILDIGEDNRVRLHYKDWHDEHWKVLELEGEELIRRYLLHVLPNRFVRIRHYGFLANCCRAGRIDEIRSAIARQGQEQGEAQEEHAGRSEPPQPPCPRCRVGRLRLIRSITPRREDGKGGRRHCLV